MAKLDESKRKDHGTVAENELDEDAHSILIQIVQGRNLMGKFFVSDFCIPTLFTSFDVPALTDFFYPTKVPKRKALSCYK